MYSIDSTTTPHHRLILHSAENAGRRTDCYLYLFFCTRHSPDATSKSSAASVSGLLPVRLGGRRGYLLHSHAVADIVDTILWVLGRGVRRGGDHRICSTVGTTNGFCAGRFGMWWIIQQA